MGFSAFALTLLFGLLWVPSTFAFGVYSLVFPIEQLFRYGFEESWESNQPMFLPRLLTLLYLICVAVLIILAPFVLRFQLARADLTDVRNFPARFYKCDVIGELHTRLEAERYKREILHLLDGVNGRDVTNIIRAYDPPPPPHTHAHTQALLPKEHSRSVPHTLILITPM